MKAGKGRRFVRWQEDRLFWRHLLWSLVFPARTQKVSLTAPGAVLILLAIGIGVAAYNTANNILFLTLALLLGGLVLSGVLSWLNFRKIRWWLEVDTPMRVGREHLAIVHVTNGKKVMPVHGLVFEVASSSAPTSKELAQRERIDPQNEAELSWTLRPLRRGHERVELQFVGSLYPFGFLRKSIAAKTSCDVIVWPASIEYRRFPVPAWKRVQTGQPLARVGHSGDLLALRDYHHGDSHRQIHWKASARLRRLVVRQFSTDNEESFLLWVTTGADVWQENEQFERLCSFSATLAEDLFRAGRLNAVAINGGPAEPVRSVKELEQFLDRLSVLTVIDSTVLARTVPPGKRNVLIFRPEGEKGVAAHVDGQKAASA
jgi:uncharacterized protein (DUF58 family)